MKPSLHSVLEPLVELVRVLCCGRFFNGAGFARRRLCCSFLFFSFLVSLFFVFCVVALVIRLTCRYCLLSLFVSIVSPTFVVSGDLVRVLQSFAWQVIVVQARGGENPHSPVSIMIQCTTTLLLYYYNTLLYVKGHATDPQMIRKIPQNRPVFIALSYHIRSYTTTAVLHAHVYVSDFWFLGSDDLLPACMILYG